MMYDLCFDFVYGGINLGDVGIGCSQFGGVIDIGINEFVVDEFNVVIVSNCIYGFFRYDFDFVGNFGVGGWNDLGIVFQIDFVFVISGRIVGGCYYDIGDCFIMFDSESCYWGWNGGVGQQGVEICFGYDFGGIVGEDVRIVMSVEIDDDGFFLVVVGV